METALVTTAAILALRLLPMISIFRSAWYVAPAVLLAAGLIPTAIKGRRFPKIGLGVGQIRRSLILVGGVCIFVFPALIAALWLMKVYGLRWPLRPVLPTELGWIRWVLYQFLYVAVAEEVFFRGYVQTNFLHLIGTLRGRSGALWRLTSIIISAACFAMAHMIIQGQIVSVMTFLPGLVLGWLFVRSGSLLAPILFHGLANTFYLVISGFLANL